MLTVPFGTAEAISWNISPKNPDSLTPVTLSVSDLSPYTAVRVQVSYDEKNWFYLDNGGQWWAGKTPVFNCTAAPCAVRYAKPSGYEAVWMRLVVQDASGNWQFGTTHPIVSWVANGDPGGSMEDRNADFAWNSPSGEFGVGEGQGVHTGSSAHWTYDGKANNGATVHCDGSSSNDPAKAGTLAMDNPPVGQWTIGTVNCHAVLGPKVWSYVGTGRYKEYSSYYASGWAWWGCHEEKDSQGTLTRACPGTFTDDQGKTINVNFWSIYLRTSKLH